MKQLILLFIALFTLQGFSQIQDPTTWSTKVEKLSETEYKLITNVVIGPGWHVYSQAKLEKDEGPIPTAFNFFKQEGNYELIGINNEFIPYAEYSSVWEFDVYQFANAARFEQVVKVLNKDLNAIFVEAYFMVCDEEQCLPPSPEALVFKLNPSSPALDAQTTIDGFYNDELVPLTAQGPEGSTIKKKSKAVTEEASKKAEKEPAKSKNAKDSSLWAIFLGCFVAGILTLVTPCVFPMIPMTVSFFTKQAGGKLQGVLYGLFILLIYVAFSVPFHLFESVSPDVFNEFSTNPWLNIFFFIIFVIFAISFFGAFEITMPNALINKVDKASNVGGLIGVFFMALTLVLVSFSCTGPVIGGVLGSVLSTDGGATALSVGLAGFGFGLGIPFALFAIFPSWMNSLPKSGGWLNTVKVFLGFLELAFAFKFLSNADLVMQWHWIEREIFIAIWVGVFGALAMYLFGKIKLPHDGLDGNISVGRMLLGLCALIFALYLLPGIWGAPLKIISGFPPPSTYSESPHGVGYKKQLSNGADTVELPENAHFGVHDIIAFDDYEHGLAYAKKVNKPVLIDFTGWACVNCRKMEERVWAEPQILKILKNDVILVSLYVDDKKSLPKNEQYTSQTTQKRIRTIGNKWSDLQIKRYQVNAQPYYALVDENGNDLKGVRQIGYTPNVDEYERWLSSGIRNYK